MDPILTTEIRKINLMTRITLILFGIFITSTIFALTVKIFEEIGIWIGLIICIALSFCGFHFKKPGSRTRVVAWSMLGTILIGTIIYFVGLNYMKSALQEFQTK